MKAIFSLALALCAVSLHVLALPPVQLTSRGTGAGGGMYYPVISPHTAQTIFLGCDMGELFFTNDGAQSWSTVNFRQLQANTLTEVQYTSDPQVLFALDWTLAAPTGFPTIQRPSRSADGGVHWMPCAGWPSTRSCYFVSAAWNSTTRIFAASPTKLYTATDGGANFNTAYDFFSAGLANGVRMCGAFYDGANVWMGSNAGLLVSSTSGDSFAIASVSGIPASEAMVSFAGAKDPSSGAIRFYCVTGTASAVKAGGIVSDYYASSPKVYYLNWGSGTWTLATTGILAGDQPGPIAMARNNINVAYVAANRPSGTYPDRNTVYKTTSAGGTWTSVFTIPSNANIATGWGGFPSNGRLDHTYPLGLCVDPNDANRAIMCDDALIHETANGGSLWQQIYVNAADQNAAGTSIPASKTYRGVGLEPTACYWLDWSSANVVSAAFSDLAMIRTTDGGASWGYPGGFAYDDIYQIIHHPATGVLYAPCNRLPSPYMAFGLSDANYDSAQGAVYFSTNSGASWSVLKGYSAFGNSAPVWVALDTTNDRLYVATASSISGGIYRIDNVSLGASAATPVKLTAPPRTEGHAYNIRILSHGELVCSYSGRYLGSVAPNQGFSQSSGVFYSTDGGQTWSDRSDAGMKYWTQDVVIDPHDLTESTWYAGVWNTFGFTPVANGQPATNTLGGLYKTTDRGVTWTRIYSADSVQTVSINPSPNHTNEMYVSTRLSGLLYCGDLRANGGPTFSQVASFPFRQPTHIFYNPYNATELWVASYGNGLLRGTIPAGSVQFNPAVFNATEGGAATITATRINGDNGAISASFATANGTATANADYTSASGALTWSDGDTATKSFTVQTLTDMLAEGTENVSLTLSAPTNGATLGSPASAVLNIADAPIDVWRLAKFGAIANVASIAGDLAFAVSDGLQNLVKYALDLDPLTPAANEAPVVSTVTVGSAKYLAITFHRALAATDVIETVEVGSVPGTWDAGSSYSAVGDIIANPFTTQYARTAGNGFETITVRDNTPSAPGIQRFLRLKVTRP